VEKIVSVNPDNIISLYYSSKEAVKLVERDLHWFSRNAITGQAILMPIELEIKWQKWSQENIPNQDEKLGDDFRLSLFCHYTEYKAWFCAPTPVQHIGNRSSTLGYNHPGKYSKVFIGEENDGLSIDWKKGLQNPKKVTYTYSEQEFKQYGL